ncbi:MAG: pteridine reductase [Gammaproteobacteria bacterium]
MSESTLSRTDRGPGTWALVTGAARRIGAAIAEALHARGCGVIVHYHGSGTEATDLVARLNGRRRDSAQALQADLCARDGPDRLAAAALDITPSLGLLVNNASRFYPTAFGATTPAQWQDLMGSNVRGAFFLTQALAGALEGGAVVNIVDIHARRPLPGHAVYGMAKAALEMMTLSLARELAPSVRVNGVAPGAILWPEHDGAGEERADILSRVPLGRCGAPEDIAGAVAYLGLDAPYVTGQVLAVDGGRSLNL